MAITRTPIVDDDGSGSTGTVIDNAWKQQFYDQIDAALVAGIVGDPAWTSVAYLAGNYSSPGGWTVQAADVQSHRYRKAGVNMELFIDLQDTDLTTGNATLFVNLPLAAVGRSMIPIMYWATGITGTALGLAITDPGSGTMRLVRDLFGLAWPAGKIYVALSGSYRIA